MDCVLVDCFAQITVFTPVACTREAEKSDARFTKICLKIESAERSLSDNCYFCRMLSHENEAFLTWWSQNREKEKTSTRPFLVGLSTGFAIGAGVIITLQSGWYTRANMEANSKLSSIVLLLAIMLVSFFMAFFYRKFRWEMQEQRYQELLAAKKRAEKQDSSSHIA